MLRSKMAIDATKTFCEALQRKAPPTHQRNYITRKTTDLGLKRTTLDDIKTKRLRKSGVKTRKNRGLHDE